MLMCHRACALAACILASAAARAAGQPVTLPRETPAPPARIVGRVVDPQTGAGRAFARVELVGEGRAASADAEGRFVFEGMSAGVHTLVAKLPGYEPSPPRTVTVGLSGEAAVDLELRLNIVADVRAPNPLPTSSPLAGASVTVLDARELTGRSGGVEDVFRILQMSPGATAVDDNRNDLLVRGAGAIESETRIDGFTVPNASHFAGQGGTAGGISLVSPWLLAQAGVQPGGFSAAYGERASAVVDLTLRSADEGRFTGTAGGGVGGGWTAFEGPISGGRGSWLASVRRSFLEFVMSAADVSEELRPRYFDGLSKLDLALSDRHRFEILTLAGKDNVVQFSGADDFETFHDDQWIGLAGVSLASNWSGRTSSRMAVSFNINDLSVVSQSRKAIDFSDDSRETELRMSGEVTRRIGRSGTVVAGAMVKRADLSFRLFEAAFRNEYNNLVAVVRSDSRDRFVDAAAYGEMTAAAGARFRLQGGVRVDRSGSSHGVYGSPRVRGEYQLARVVKLTGAGGIYRQSIPYVWIGSAPQNASLDPVRSSQVVAGVDAILGRRTRLVVEGFEKRYTGYPVDPVAPARVLISALADFESPFVGPLTSAGRVRAMGVDAVVSSDLGAGLEATVSYSLWKVRQAGLDGIWRAADYDIRNQGRVMLGYTLPSLYISLSWRYADGRPYTPYDFAASIKARSGRYDLTRVNAVRYPPYHRLDGRVERTFDLRKARLLGYIEVENLYDRSNIHHYDWDNTLKGPKAVGQWGRLVMGGIGVSF
jgi:hypothetical protein